MAIVDFEVEPDGKITLNDTPRMNGLFVVNRIIDVLFTTDIIINFFRSYEDELRGVHVTELSAIQEHYLSFW